MDTRSVDGQTLMSRSHCFMRLVIVSLRKSMLNVCFECLKQQPSTLFNRGYVRVPYFLNIRITSFKKELSLI